MGCVELKASTVSRIDHNEVIRHTAPANDVLIMTISTICDEVVGLGLDAFHLSSMVCHTYLYKYLLYNFVVVVGS